MPFTPAHPAIILPFLKRKYFSATGLVIGSMSPDFEYFFKASVSGVHGHTFLGLFYFDLPVTFFWAIIFHRLIKPSLLTNLPAFFQTRLQTLRVLDFKKYLSTHSVVFGMSALLGAASHIFWDSFTHNNTYLVRHLEIYNQVHVPFQGVNYPFWYALQHISTGVGIISISIYFFYLPADNKLKPSSPKLLYWVSLILLGAVFFVIRFLLLPKEFNLGNAVVTAISSLLLAVCLVSLMPYFKSPSLHN
jgi:hypothetical protein